MGFVMLCTFIYAYGNIAAVTDEFQSRKAVEQAREALKHSSKIAIAHPYTTFKFMFLNMFLELRFFVTTAFVIAIPAFLVRVALQLGLVSDQ
jgi:hypothetical protein